MTRRPGAPCFGTGGVFCPRALQEAVRGGELIGNVDHQAQVGFHQLRQGRKCRAASRLVSAGNFGVDGGGHLLPGLVVGVVGQGGDGGGDIGFRGVFLPGILPLTRRERTTRRRFLVLTLGTAWNKYFMK